MGFSKDLSGLKFNKLTVIDHAGNNARGQSRWNCQCDCGVIKEIDGYALKNQYSCGCEAYPFVDLTGKRFGKLTVIKLIGIDDKSRNRKWECLCDCGGTKNTITASLNRGRARSCGCLSREFNAKQKLPNFTAIANETLYRYKNNAKTRNYSWEISDEKAFELFSQDCYWCGDPPKSKGRDRNDRGNSFVNGIDRVDNTVGYTDENVVPCCKICNKIKMDLSIDDFLGNIEKIYKKHIIAKGEN